MYKIAVCDDNPADADYVSDAIKKSAQARSHGGDRAVPLCGGILVSI